MVGAIESTAFSLLTNPLTGRLGGFLGALADLRLSLVRDCHSYLLFCRPTLAGIEVLRVLHGARDLPRMLGRNPP